LKYQLLVIEMPVCRDPQLPDYLAIYARTKEEARQHVRWILEK